MLKFRRETSANFQIGKRPLDLAISNVQVLFVNKFDFNSS